MSGKVVVNRCVSVDGFIAGPGHRMDFGGRPLADLVAREDFFAVAGATGAMLVGRKTFDVGGELDAAEAGTVDYPFTGPMYLLSHRPPDPPVPGVTVLSGDIEAAVTTALAAADGKDLEILGADVAAQCFAHGLVDELLVYVVPVVLGDGIPFSPPGAGRAALDLISARQSGDVAMLRFRVRKDPSG